MKKLIVRIVGLKYHKNVDFLLNYKNLLNLVVFRQKMSEPR